MVHTGIKTNQGLLLFGCFTKRDKYRKHRGSLKEAEYKESSIQFC